jgi:hypothetical protein
MALIPTQVAEIWVNATKSREASRGTGYLICSGCLLTARHVVKNCSDTDVTFRLLSDFLEDRDRWPKSYRIWRSEAFDLALIFFVCTKSLDNSQTSCNFKIPSVLRLTQDQLISCRSHGFPAFTEKDGHYRDHPLKGEVQLLGSVKNPEIAEFRIQGEIPHSGMAAWEGFSGSPVFTEKGLLAGIITQGFDEYRGGILEVLSIGWLLDHSPIDQDFYGALECHSLEMICCYLSWSKAKLPTQRQQSCLEPVQEWIHSLARRVYQVLQPKNYVPALAGTGNFLEILVALRRLPTDHLREVLGNQAGTALQGFIAYLQAHPGAEKVQAALRQWLQAQPEVPMILEPWLQNWITVIEHKINPAPVSTASAEQSVEPDAPTLLLEGPQLLITIKDKKASDLYEVEAHLVPNPRVYNPKDNDSFHKLAEPEEYQKDIAAERSDAGLTLEDMQNVLIGCLEECQDYAIDLRQLSLNVFLPSDCLNWDIDQWPVDEDGDDRLGMNHWVLVRSLDRLQEKSCTAWQKLWQEKWQLLEAEAQAMAQNHFVLIENPDWDGLRVKLQEPERQTQTDPWQALYWQMPPCGGDLEQNRRLWLALFKSGTPLALWPRSACTEAQQSWNQTCQDLLQYPLNEFLTQVQRRRRQAYLNCRTDLHPDHHISLLWENPHLVPPLPPPSRRRDRRKRLQVPHAS